MTIAQFTVPPVVKAVSVRAAPARAFELFARDFGRWWPVARFHTGPDPVDCTLEQHVGGRVFERAADGTQTLWGTVVAYDPPHRLAFSWIVGGLAPDEAQLVEINFTPEGGGTRIELSHSGWEKLGERGKSLRERYEGGWATLIERCYADYADAAA
ncbi:MAG TPA: SRPBCC domain-containing protein [Stellaceae bacterium]|jgi:uncharacterized protein YndB with AHSA1/START domain|nr:SRPBCC domain-containing protein [Stellaceae bacterium]